MSTKGTRIEFTIGTVAVIAIASSCLDWNRPTFSDGARRTDSLAQATIRAENVRPGDGGWNRVARPASREEIAAYLSQRSAFPGDSVGFYGISQDSTLAVSLYRVGWYGGAGARLVMDVGTVKVPPTSACSAPLPGPAECIWPRAITIPIPSDAVPGVYMVRYTSSLGAGRFVPLVLRSREQPSITVVLSFNTYEAYNSWGGASLYTLPDGSSRSSRVSFLRPYTDEALSGRLLLTDLPLVRFLERWDYPVSFVADRDFDAEDDIGRGARAVVFSGHSEYWSARMRDHAEQRRSEGVGLAFFGANDSYWQVRYEGPSEGYHGDVLVCYKSTADPLINQRDLATVRFRDQAVSRPENGLIGIMYNGHPNGLRFVPLRAWDTALPFFQGTGFQPGDLTTVIGGWEGDKAIDNGMTPRGLRVLFEESYLGDTPGTSDVMQTTFYAAGSGAGVFAAGTVVWNWALDDLRPSVADVRVQRFVKNLLNWYLR
jgi:hypothetical protein